MKKTILVKLLCSAVMALSFFAKAQYENEYTHKQYPPIFTVEQLKEQVFINQKYPYYISKIPKDKGMIRVLVKGKIAQRIEGSNYHFFLASDVGIGDYEPEDIIILEIKTGYIIGIDESFESDVIIEGMMPVDQIKPENINQWLNASIDIDNKAVNYLNAFYGQYEDPKNAQIIFVTNVKYKQKSTYEQLFNYYRWLSNNCRQVQHDLSNRISKASNYFMLSFMGWLKSQIESDFRKMAVNRKTIKCR